MKPIKMVDLHRQYLSMKSEIDQAISSVLERTDFILGSAVRDFEVDLARYLDVPFAVGCGSGTDALQIAMMALGIGPGDEVITTPFTFVATAETIVLLGARPVYVDIDPRTYNLQADQLEEKITSRTKAIVPVHLYGQPADMDPILRLARDRGLHVIEDTAQAIGARYHDRPAGTMGDVGCLSFFPSKNLGAFGDAGALITRDESLASRCRMIAVHGSRAKYQHEILGVNSRLDTLQAAVLKAKLPYLEAWTQARIEVARKYDQGLSGLPIVVPHVASGVRHVYHQYSIRSDRRDALGEFLKNRGIAHAVHYPIPLHRQPAFRQQVDPDDKFPVAEAVSREIISLPIFPEMEDSEIETVVSSVRRFYAG
ncbi:MAG: DegT/DnrJ/EryC1/StrS family aminotransferase [Acidobacteriota bacterium]